MKQPKKLSRIQKMKLSRKGLDPDEWRLIHESKTDLQLIHKLTDEIKTIQK
ncbi:Uncharacterised protein [[Eubacterium] contortum]|uniref:DUF6906 domain-containing protein n=1 Tax=Faecalicatena contorta TaxID=39482 RepID=A0A174JMQ0_9FIRM|nr:hypothetical protein [Faecalicatena contorta]CUO98339.1 Uncharacterised protein [[Eubacterium] contortum] [Faecalicatena contorta]